MRTGASTITFFTHLQHTFSQPFSSTLTLTPTNVCGFSFGKSPGFFESTMWSEGATEVSFCCCCCTSFTMPIVRVPSSFAFVFVASGPSDL